MTGIPPKLPAILLVALSFLLPLVPRAKGAEEFEYGPRPPLSVFDPSGVLKPELVKKVSDPLAMLYRNEGIDVIVVVMTDLGTAPPEHVAQQFAQAWCKSPIHCVVLYVPGREDSPWIIPDGKLIDHLVPEQVQRAVADAERRSRSEPKDGDKVKAAATEATDMLRYWMANAINRSEIIQTESTRMRVEQELKSRQLKIIMVAACASFIPLVVGIAYLAVFIRRRGPGYFPNHAWQLRLGAPHAGGNQAIVDLGKPLS